MRLKNLLRIGVVIVQLSLFNVVLRAQLLNVDFGSGLTSPKVGPAATGQSTNDYWNFYTRDDGSGGFRTFGAVPNLKWADGTISTVGLTVTNAAGAWQNGAADPMYDVYLYPLGGGNITVTMTNLPVGNYDVFLYGHGGPGVDMANSIFGVVSASGGYGTKATTTNSGWASPVWQEGQQYVVFRDVGVTNSGGSVTTTVFPGAYGQAYISGLQLVTKSSPTPPPPVLNVDFGSGTTTAKTGFAATGQSTNDYWNFYTRDDGSGGYRTFGALNNLKWADGTVSPAGLTVTNAPGAWQNGAADPMYDVYLYPLIGSNITVTVTNLAVGNYDLFLYGHGGPGVDTANSVFKVVSGSSDYGTKATTTNSGWASPVWLEGQQYVVFRDVEVVNGGGPVTITVSPGAYGQAYLNGMQVVQKSSTPSCVTPFPGLVGWWKGDGNATDSTGANNGTLSGNVTFGSGLVGQAFAFDGANDSIVIGNPAALQLQDFSIEAWVKRSSTNQASLDVFTQGGIFGYGYGGYTLNVWDDGRLAFGKVGISGINSTKSIKDTNWHHVAVSKASGAVVFYVDGVGEVGQQYDPGFYFTSSAQIGAIQWDSTQPRASFLGSIDEVSVYNRALSASEFESIYNAGSTGKCGLPPRILIQPQDLTVLAGENVTFAVGANGTPPLSYQWRLGVTNIAGATNSLLTISNAQPSNAGNYNVLVTSAYGTATSSNAVLTVTVPPTCVPAPAGLVSWWKAEGNANDSADGNHGILVNGVSFAPGKTGQALSFDGIDDYVSIAPSASLNVGAGNGFTIESWIKPSELLVSRPLFEWDNISGQLFGVHFWSSASVSGIVPGALFANIVDTANNYHMVESAGGILNTNQFQHIALTYDKTTGVTTIYHNGTVVATQNLGIFTPQTSGPLHLGERHVGAGAGKVFQGLMDEVGVYSRPLSGNEIAAIYHASSAGKCPLPLLPGRSLAHWKFDETNGPVAYDSAGAFNGTLSSSGASFVSGGISGGALSLSKTNNGFVSMGNVLGLAETDFSLVAWIKMSPGDRSDAAILTKVAAYSRNGYLLVVNKSGALLRDDKASLIQGGSGVATYTLDETPVSTTSVNDGNWHQIVAVYQLGGMKSIYVDGAPVEDSKPSQPFNQNSVAFLIGGVNFDGVPAGVFNGLIDDVQIYDFALSASHVDYLFTHPGEEIPSSACVPAPSGLVSWWGGDGNANDSQDSNSGTPQNGTTFTAGKVGQAFSFDGVDDQVLVPHNANQNTGSQITIDAWVNPSSSGHGRTILQKRSASNVGGYIFETLGQPFAPDNGLQFVIAIGGTYYSCMTTNSVLTLNTWQHVAATYDGSAMRIYVNGVERASAAVSGAINAVTDPIVIGRNVVFPVNAWQGLIDEVDLFNRALSSSEIQAIYNAGSAGKCVSTCVAAPAGLVGWWPAEGNGSDPGGGNTGNLQGNTSFAPGAVGRAFTFDGTGDGVVVGNPTNLQLQNFTIEAWIRRRDPSKASGALNTGGAIFVYGSGGYGLGMLDDGTLFLTRVDVSNVTSDFVIGDTNWHHVAVSKSGSAVVFYVDGTAHPVASAYNDVFTFASNAAIGARGDNLSGSFIGDIDELAIYNRPLSASEVQSIYAAAGTGKCPFPPPISVTISPASGFYTNAVTVTLDATSTNAAIRYTLDGTTPTANSQVYVGPFGLTNTATVSALAFTNGIQASELAVSTFRFWGASSGCVAPAGAISWWTGDGEAQDALGLNHGRVLANTGFEPGLVGQAFSFGAEGDAVTVTNSPSLQLQNFTIEAWVKRRSTNQATLGLYGGGAIFAYGSGGYALSMLDNGRLLLGKVGVDSVTSIGVITNTSWHHVAVTKSGTNVSFFVDGVSAGNAIYNNTFSFSSNPAIGATGTSLIASFYGLIDELAIYARPLATNEIQALFSAGASGKCPTFAPIIVTAPQNRTVPAGGNTSFSVTAGGSPTLNYQWSLNGTLIPDATNAVLDVNSVNSTNAGTYAVTVSNGFAPPVTASATLTISLPPAITQQPRSQIVMVGSTATFTVGYTGTPPLTFQWRRNGILIGGGNSPTLVINNVQSANAGTYTVRISNALNFAMSQPATLTVASGQFSALTPTANGIQLSVQGESGGNYIIETSVDLRQWEPLATLLNNPQNWQFTDTTATGVSQRFYRLRKTP